MRLFGFLGGAVLLVSGAPAFAQGRSGATALSVMSDGEIVVRFDGMRGREGDWIALAAPGSPPTEYVAWQYTGGARRGSLTFPEVPAGDLVARAYFGSSSYVVRATSAPFRVPDRCGLSGVTRSLVARADGDTVVVRFAGLCGESRDWIGLAPPGSPSGQYVAWQYTASEREGVLTFENLGEGDYVARAYSGPSPYVIRAESAPVHVVDRCRQGDGGLRAIAANADGDDVFVRFGSPCGRATDWVALAPVDAPAQQYGAWRYTDGADQGTFTFADVPPGRWVARLFTDWSGTRSYAIRAQSAPFCVAAPGQVCGDLAVAR